jgi:hypothetical protein
MELWRIKTKAASLHHLRISLHPSTASSRGSCINTSHTDRLDRQLKIPEHRYELSLRPSARSCASFSKLFTVKDFTEDVSTHQITLTLG